MVRLYNRSSAGIKMEMTGIAIFYFGHWVAPKSKIIVVEFLNIAYCVRTQVFKKNYSLYIKNGFKLKFNEVQTERQSRTFESNYKKRSDLGSIYIIVA